VVVVASDSHNHSESDRTCETEKGRKLLSRLWRRRRRLVPSTAPADSPRTATPTAPRREPREGTRVPIRGGCDLCRQPANTSESDVAL
jgi:hypothetical protein